MIENDKNRIILNRKILKITKIWRFYIMPVFKAKNGKVFRESMSSVNGKKFGPVYATGTNEFNSGEFWPAPTDDLVLVSAEPYFKPYVEFEKSVVVNKLTGNADDDVETVVVYEVPEVEAHADYTLTLDSPVAFRINSEDAPLVTLGGFRFKGGLVGRLIFPKEEASGSNYTVKVTIARTECIKSEPVVVNNTVNTTEG